MSSYLDQFTQALKRTPGNLAGAPVDMANLVAGLVAGKGIDGLVENPVGGSKQLNSLFGLDSKSSGIVQDSVEAMTGLLTPGGAAKAVVGGMVVPARLLGDKSLKSMLEFVRAESIAGKTPKALYDQTGIWRDTLDPKKLKGIIDDSSAVFRRSNPRFFNMPGAYGIKDTRIEQATTVKELIEHPELIKILQGDDRLRPILDYKVTAEHPSSGAWGSYNPNTNEISLAPRGSEKDLMSTLLHEIQHAIQYGAGHIGGGNPDMFIEYSGRVQRAQREVKTAYRNSLTEVSSTTQGSAEEAAAIAKNKQIKQDLDTIENVNQKAYRRYLELQGETEARMTQRMFMDPRERTAFDPAFPDPAKGIRASDLKDPKEVITKFDMEPSVKALIDRYQPTPKP